MQNRISSERAQIKISQTTLAKELGVTRDTISAWENGGEIPASAVRKMASNIFKCSADWILGLSDHRESRSA